MLNKFFGFGSLGALVLMLAACSSFTTPPGPYGIRHLIGSSGGSRPQWIDKPRYYQLKHADRIYAVGIAPHEVDYELARSISYADALRNLARRIKSTVHVLYTSASTEDRGSSDYNVDVQRAVEDGTLQTAFGIITGAEVDRYYWRQYWVQEEQGSPVKYYRNVYALVSMSRTHFDQTVYQTLNRTEKTVHDPRAQHVIKEMKHRWLTNKIIGPEPPTSVDLTPKN